MAEPSITEEKHEWDAVKVRNTFLDYFKKNGHTFGRLSLSVCV
jgi:alanyl-tRNA synthetase